MRRYGHGVGFKSGGVSLCGCVDQDDGCRSRRGRAELLVGDKNAGAGVLDDVDDFVRCQPVVDGKKDRADVARRERNVEKCGAVLHEHRDHVVRTDPDR